MTSAHLPGGEPGSGAPVIKKCTGVLAAADLRPASTAFIILESIRLDLGTGSQIHP